MKKLSLILALILVLTCGVLAACGDDTDTSSDAGSSAADSSAASDASSEAASSEDASSEDASSEDASSEDASSEDDSSEPEEGDVSEGVAVDNPTGTNVALGKNYTGGDVAMVNGAPSGYSAHLTDGKVSTATTYDASWYGLYYNIGAAAPSNNAPNGVATITVDLGAKTDNLSAIRVHLWNHNASGITGPSSIVAQVSEDGTNFTNVGSLVLPEGDDPAWASIATDVSAQYVRLVITTGSGTWCFLNEIEVYA